MASVYLSFPDGRVVQLRQTDAEAITDRLRARAEEPGALVCAAVLAQALSRPTFGRIEIRQREAAMLASVLDEQ